MATSILIIITILSNDKSTFCLKNVFDVQKVPKKVISINGHALYNWFDEEIIQYTSTYNLSQ